MKEAPKIFLKKFLFMNERQAIEATKHELRERELQAQIDELRKGAEKQNHE